MKKKVLSLTDLHYLNFHIIKDKNFLGNSQWHLQGQSSLSAWTFSAYPNKIETNKSFPPFLENECMDKPPKCLCSGNV